MIESIEEEVKPTKDPKDKEAKRASALAGKKKSLIKKLDTETAKLLGSLNEKANKKTHGRKIRDAEILHLGLTLIGPKDLEELKEKSLSEKDRLNIAFEEYQKSHGKITMDAFIGKLIRKEV